MKKQRLKEKLEQFRQWQEQPFDYNYSPDRVVHCNNCGHEYAGNFCPVCSQKAGMGRIGWHSVRQGIMDIWGLGTRSLLFSVWQLLWRPGHLIGQYIDGQRQVSFPPVKMLFILAVIYSMVVYWFFPEVLGITIIDDIAGNEKVNLLLSDISAWMKRNYSWTSLSMAVLAVFPTWVMFRYSPRHTAHSLPEGFFIQVFLANLMVVVGFLIFPLGMINPMLITIVSWILFAVYYIIVYKYLFGYGLWGTLWRCGFIYFTIVFFLSGVLFVAFDVDLNAMNPNLTERQIALVKFAFTIGFLIMTILTVASGYVINLIATRKARRELKLKKTK